jgi:hypothetical protein
MNDELERLRLSEFLLERWMGSQKQEYNDYMVTEEIRPVLEIGDAINRGEISIAPVAVNVSYEKPQPFVLTEEVLAMQERLETALRNVRARIRSIQHSVSS